MRSTSSIFVALVLATSCLAARTAEASEMCVKCHVKPSEAVTDRRIFHRDRYNAGFHAGVACTECHKGADPKAFFALPHRLSGPPPSCTDCHAKNFPEIIQDFHRSVHARLEEFACAKCHDTHHMRKLASLPPEERARESNSRCVDCHQAAIVRTPGLQGLRGLREAHAWLPRQDKHMKMRCVVCHTPADGAHVHEVLTSAHAIRSCDACHDVSSPLIAKYVGGDDPSSWVTNPLVFEEAYVPGATRNRVVDGFLRALFWVMVGMLVLHALARVATRRNRPRMSASVEKVKMYPVWLRVWHWSNAILFIVLAYTGIRMHFGQRPGPVMSFETAFNVHNLAGALLVIVAVVYFIGNLRSRNQRQYLSRPRDGLRGVLKQARWYAYGIFKGEPHPYHASPEKKFNPLQHVTYVGIMYVAYPLLLLSGVLLLFPGILPNSMLGRPGTFWVAALHWIVAVAAIFFLVGHIYMGSMGDKVRDLYAAMFDGKHRHRKPGP